MCWSGTSETMSALQIGITINGQLCKFNCYISILCLKVYLKYMLANKSTHLKVDSLLGLDNTYKKLNDY